MEIGFAPFAEEHLPLLRGWLREPHVAEFWQEAEDDAELRDKFLRQLPARGVHAFVILLDRKPAGFIQHYEARRVGGGWWLAEKAGVHGIDQFLGEASLLGQGLGTKIIEKFVLTLFSDHSVSEVIADPAPNNARAIRAFEKVGFRREKEITTPGGAALLLRLGREDFFRRTNLDLAGAVSMFRATMQDFAGFWCVAGGWAIDLFLGRQTRAHEDLEIVVLREEQAALYRHFSGLHPSLIYSGDPPRFVPWKGEPIDEEVIQLRLAPLPRPVEFDLLLSPSANGQWICRRDESLRLPLEEVRSFREIPYLRPEIVLLFKAKRVEAKDQHDFEVAWPHLSPAAREWLRGNLARLYPGHAWLRALE